MSFYGLANWTAWGRDLLEQSFSVLEIAFFEIKVVAHWFEIDIQDHLTNPMLVHALSCLVLVTKIYTKSLQYYIILLLIAATFALCNMDRRSRGECLPDDENDVNLEWVGVVGFINLFLQSLGGNSNFL